MLWGLLWLALVGSSASAQVKVAFMNLQSPSGETVQLEREGRFNHIAVSVQILENGRWIEKWIHSVPPQGVELVDKTQLRTHGKIVEILEWATVPALGIREIERYLGRPYDYGYSWSGEGFYCSELIAKLLGLKPKPMEFAEGLWPESYQAKRGELGLSPDDVYQQLLPYRRTGISMSCRQVFSL